MAATRFQHEKPERVCTLDSAGRWVWSAERGPISLCDLLHEDGQGGLLLQERQELPSERGGLGMPTLGIAPGRLFETPVTYAMVITENGIGVNYGEQGFNAEAETPEARYILLKVLPRLLQRFLRKNEQYARAQTGHDLGIKGIIPDINRKSAAIITRVWDRDNADPDILQDDVEELCDDLIGHLLLLKAKLGLATES